MRAKPIYFVAPLLIVVWSLLAVGIAIGFVVLLAMLNKAQSAIQEAAIAALCACMFIGLYVIVRSVDKIAFWLAPLLKRNREGEE